MSFFRRSYINLIPYITHYINILAYNLLNQLKLQFNRIRIANIELSVILLMKVFNVSISTTKRSFIIQL